MQLVEVKDDRQARAFVRLPHKLYSQDPNWIAPLDKDIEAVFDTKKNPALAHCEYIRWLLYDDAGNTIGRVAAWVNHKAIKAMEFPVGAFGFFECINDKKAAFMLFDACRDWLTAKGMKGMDGPINMGERDRFWGLLVEGFTPPTYMEAYNPSWYKAFFEEYGFRLYFQQDTYVLRKETFRHERLERIVSLIRQKRNIELRHLEKSKLKQYASDFTYIYNAAWEKFENFRPVTPQDILKTFKGMLPIVEEKYIWFVYVDGEPAGFIVALPDVNQLFKYLHGKFNLWSKLKFLWLKRTKKIGRLKGLVFGIHPAYHNIGLDGVMVYQEYVAMREDWKYTSIAISWVGGFNPKMQSLMQSVAGTVEKVHYTYRILFDPSLEFKPYSLGEYSKNE